jgi:hypothetical protein
VRGKHGVTILAPFALLDTDDHALAVDVSDLEVGHLGHAQARAVGYAVAARLEAADLEGMKRSANVIVDLIGTTEPRDCAAEAVAMRLHPREPVNA